MIKTTNENKSVHEYMNEWKEISRSHSLLEIIKHVIYVLYIQMKLMHLNTFFKVLFHNSLPHIPLLQSNADY